VRTNPDPKPSNSSPAPFVKWAGGKKSLTPQILEIIGHEQFGRYFEPFVGGGALFFALRPKRAILSDSNEVLINAYRQVQSNVNSVIKRLKWYQQNHSREFYYKVRQSRPQELVERAAWFIYLNRTCFNGLWRVNSAGQFNVPMGSYKHPRILDEERLRSASRALRGATLHCADFETALTKLAPRPRLGDLVYFDPPYDPLSHTSNFTSYTKENFGQADQRRLAKLARVLVARGVQVLISDSETEFIRTLFSGAPFRTEIVRMARAINSVGTRRGQIPELLIYGDQVSSP
jgi:DNA adenine methylase